MSTQRWNGWWDKPLMEWMADVLCMMAVTYAFLAVIFTA